MPEDMSDRMPEDMPDRMPEDLPVRKCINVMVGITRSKVFFLAWCWLGGGGQWRGVITFFGLEHIWDVMS